MGKNSTTYTPFYPTALGTKHHDITLRQLPAYSMGAKPEIKTKFSNKLGVPIVQPKVQLFVQI